MNKVRLMAAAFALPAALASSHAFALAAPVFVTNPQNDPVPVTVTGNSGTSNVNVTNGQLTVRDADNPARQPFNASVDPCNASGPLAVVPAGKVLVVETVNASITVFPAGNFPVVLLEDFVQSGTATSAVAVYDIQMPLQGNFSIGSTYVATHAVRYYFPANHTVAAGVVPENGGGCTSRVTISGYFVNAGP